MLLETGLNLGPCEYWPAMLPSRPLGQLNIYFC
jgi:hypothetical protein